MNPESITVGNLTINSLQMLLLCILLTLMCTGVNAILQNKESNDFSKGVSILGMSVLLFFTCFWTLKISFFFCEVLDIATFMITTCMLLWLYKKSESS